MISSPSSLAQPGRRRNDSNDHLRAGLTAAGPSGGTSGYSSPSSGGFVQTEGSVIPTETSTPTNNLMNLEEGSSTSHASSSRLGTSTTSRQALHLPLSLADALSRANDDETRALDEVLAERNKLCLEVTKLGTENIRIWNLVRRIKKENEELKASSRSAIVASTSTPLQHSIASNIRLSPSPSSTGQDASYGSTPSTLGISNLLSTSRGSSLTSPLSAPSINQPPGRQLKGSDPTPLNAGSSNTALPISTSVSSPPSARLFTAESVASESETTEMQSADTQFLQQSPKISSAVEPSRELLQSPQQTSIMKQRAAAQAQRLAAMASPMAGGGSSGRSSFEGQEFEAIDGSSVANSDEEAIANRTVTTDAVRPTTRDGGQPTTSTVPGPQLQQVPSTAAASERTGMSSDTLGLRMGSSASPRLDATMLNYANVAVVGTNLRSNDRGKDDISFYLSVDLKAPPSGNKSNISSWRVEKIYTDIVALDARLKQKNGKNKNAVKRISSAQLPDRTLFKDHAPSKVDKRKVMLEVYLQNLLAIPLLDKEDLCTFLCTDAIPVKPTDPDATTKEGFLTKKGANLGRWVTRLYVLSGSNLDYYEARGGPHLGSINIVGAQIGRQQRSEVTSADKEMDENSYRHAFLILESKPAQASGEQKQMVRHVLCAESDEERDEWVNILVRAIAGIGGPTANQGNNPNTNKGGRTSPSRSFSASSMPTSPTTPTIRKTSKYDPVEGGGGVNSRGNRNGSGVISSGTNINGVAPLTLSPRQGSYNLRPLEAQNNSMHAPPAVSYPASTSGGPSGSDPTRSQSDFGRYSIDDQNNSNGFRQGNQQQNISQTQPLFSQPTSSQPQQQVQPVPKIGRARSATQEQVGILPNTIPPAIVETGTTGTSQMTESASNTSGLTTLSGKERSNSRPAISGPMNGTPIPTGYKFGGGKDEGGSSTGNDTKKRFWHRFGGAGGGSDKGGPPKKVFGVSLAESIAVSNVSEGLELPSVVYRCIEYLEKKNAAMEEGIYRLSGSSNVIKSLRERFDAQGDVNLLASSEPFYDVHAIAGLLKQFLRELTNSVLTRELHFDFMRINDIADRKERVNELGHLVSLLPLANYSLLRTLCSHLIKVIELSDINKMTMRNVGIVFSPTLGIPGGVFALFLTEFDWVFFTDAKGEPAPKQMDEDIIAPDSAELGLRGRFPASDEQWQDDQQQSSRRTSAQEEQDEEKGVRGGNDSNRAGHKNRSSWVSGDAIHGGDGRIMTNLQKPLNRDNRNSLCYNESEADKLLGGPQSRYRLSSNHKVLEETMQTTPVEAIEGNESFLGQLEGFSEPQLIEDQVLGSPKTYPHQIQASPRISSRKLQNQNNLTLNRNALANEGSYYGVQVHPPGSTTPTSPTSTMRTGHSNQNPSNNNPRMGGIVQPNTNFNEGY